MGLLDGAFRFSDDPDDNMAKNRALTMLGAGLLGSRGNFSQALGNAVAGSVGAYDDAMNSQAKRRYMEGLAQAQQMQLARFQQEAEDRKRLMAQQAAMAQAAQGAVMPGSPGSLGGGVAPGSQQGQMLLGQASGDNEFDAAMLQSTNAALNSVGPKQEIAGPTAPRFDPQRYITNLYGAGMPLQAEEFRKANKPENPFNKIDPKDYTPESIAAFARSGYDPTTLVPVRKSEFVNGVAVNPYDVKPGTVLNNPQAVANDLVIPDGNGGFKLNDVVMSAKSKIARAGASNTTVKVENKMGESVAAQVGPMLRDSAMATTGAVKMADSANRILEAIDKGGVIAGPTATLRMKAAQVASMFGIGGKDAVAQTRQVIRGLAESSVEARKELAGQGAVTESEGLAVEKAMSGKIDDLTVEEIRDIARLNLRAAAMRAQGHQQRLDALPPEMNAARPFYGVPGIEGVLKIDPSRYAIRPPTGANVAPDGKTATGTIGGAPAQRVLRFDKNGNPVK